MNETAKRDFSPIQEKYKQIFNKLGPILKKFEIKKNEHQQKIEKGGFTRGQHEQDNDEIEKISIEMDKKVKELDSTYQLDFPQYPGQSVSKFFVEGVKDNGINLYRSIIQTGKIEGEKGNNWVLSDAGEHLEITFKPNGDIKKDLKLARYTQIPPEKGQRTLEDYEKKYVKVAGSNWQEQTETK